MNLKIRNVVFGIGVGIITVISIIGILFEIRFWYRVYPGINISGIDVGGQNLKQTAQAILRQTAIIKQIKLKWGVNEWYETLSNMGVVYDVNKSVEEALEVGRTGDFLKDFNSKVRAVTGGVKLEPVWSWDKNSVDMAVASVAAQIDIPVQDPAIQRDKTNQTVVVNTGENGQQVDQNLLKLKIQNSLDNWGIGTVDIPVVELKPKLTIEQANLVKNKALSLLGKKIVLQFPDNKQSWIINDDQLLTWLDLQSGEGKKSAIKDWVTELAQTVNRDPQNATFRFIGQGRVEEFTPAKNGVTVLQEETTDLIAGAMDKMVDGVNEQDIDLAVSYTPPDIKTEDVNNLGIKELIGKGESWFKGSIDNRIFNLKKAALSINGVLVAPGEIFSFNKTVGEVSQSTGYKQAYVIKEGKTVLGDGGGVCQVSTTLFRAVLATGLPIIERAAHAYRVSYYEVNYQPGFDATVFQPSPDFKFRNDTSNYILIQTVYDEKAQYLSFELYGTSDGRKVEISKARIWDVTPPPPDLFQDDPTLPSGKVVQTEHATWGAKVAFDWKVTRGGVVLQQKTFYTNYQPWQAVFLRGTKPN